MNAFNENIDWDEFHKDHVIVNIYLEGMKYLLKVIFIVAIKEYVYLIAMQTHSHLIRYFSSRDQRNGCVCEL